MVLGQVSDDRRPAGASRGPLAEPAVESARAVSFVTPPAKFGPPRAVGAGHESRHGRAHSVKVLGTGPIPVQ